MTQDIHCDNVSLFRSGPDGERALVNEVSARFPAGSLCLIQGAVGAGKSSLLHVLAGLLRPSSGEVRVGSEAISRYTGPHRDLWRRKAGIVFQQLHMLADLSVQENLLLPLVVRDVTLTQARERVEKQLQALQLDALSGQPLQSLSGGERQRVAVARALIAQPDYVFADEPSAHQDDSGAELVLQQLAAARENGATVILVSHDARLHDFDGIDFRFQMREGRLFSENEPEASADTAEPS